MLFYYLIPNSILNLLFNQPLILLHSYINYPQCSSFLWLWPFVFPSPPLWPSPRPGTPTCARVPLSRFRHNQQQNCHLLGHLQLHDIFVSSHEQFHLQLRNGSIGAVSGQPINTKIQLLLHRSNSKGCNLADGAALPQRDRADQPLHQCAVFAGVAQFSLPHRLQFL